MAIFFILKIVESAELIFEGPTPLLERRDFLTDGAHLGLSGLGLIAFAVAKQRPDLLGAGIAFGLELFEANNESAPFGVDLEQPFQGRIGVAQLEHAAHSVRI